jgi:hypothetical protein
MASPHFVNAIQRQTTLMPAQRATQRISGPARFASAYHRVPQLSNQAHQGRPVDILQGVARLRAAGAGVAGQVQTEVIGANFHGAQYGVLQQ